MPTTLKTAQTKSFADSAQEDVAQRVRHIIGDIRARGAAAVAEYRPTSGSTASRSPRSSPPCRSR